jgi:hypothetical protein
MMSPRIRTPKPVYIAIWDVELRCPAGDARVLSHAIASIFLVVSNASRQCSVYRLLLTHRTFTVPEVDLIRMVLAS